MTFCYDVIGCIHTTYKELSPGLPEPVFQEALLISLHNAGFKDAEREFVCHPTFFGRTLQSSIRLDMVVPKQGECIVIECKSIQKLTDRERIQLFGYMRGTQYPIGILVNFGTYPRAEIERYYYDRTKKQVTAF